MFNRESQLSLFPTALEWEDRMPYMVKLNFPVDNSSYTWGDMIYDSGFENLMLSFAWELLYAERHLITIMYVMKAQEHL